MTSTHEGCLDQPNLFRLATKELSQDAFIAWLLQWSAPNCKAFNGPLHLAASSFLKKLISLQGDAPSEITHVEAGRQLENIDVWAKVNNTHLIIIEDKVGTREHSNQLQRYKEIAEALCEEQKRQLICVYIKTHSDSASNLRKIEEQGYAVINRRDFLNHLEEHTVESDIYNDFKDYLRGIEDNESQFTHKPLGEWSGNDWKGLYQLIEEKKPGVDWGYVNNPTGGFWNIVLNWYEVNGFAIYMQIEEGHLCFKLGEVHENRRENRNKYHQLLMDSATEGMKLERPKRFGSGKYMTVGIITKEHWLGADKELLNAEAVILRINSYEEWLRSIVQNAMNSSEKTILAQ